MGSHVTRDVVALEFNISDFQKGIGGALRSLESLQTGLQLKGGTKGIERVEEASNKVDFHNMTTSLEGAQQALSYFGVLGRSIFVELTTSALEFATSLAGDLFLGPMRDGMGEFELQMNSIQTILANTSSKGTTIDDVNAALAELNNYADLTIFNFADMTSSIGKFTAAGVDLDPSVQAIKGISNLAALSGSSSAEASMAMYQLSQAIASGTTTLMDWKSVVNAGMGGEVFKNSLVETARVHGIAIDDMIADAGSFQASLEKKWLTTDIMLETLSKFTGDMTEEELLALGYTKDQIEGITELGELAIDAATKVKSIPQIFDVFGEAMGSGWASTWQLVFGDFYHARDLFTGVSEWLGDFVSANATARNEVVAKWEQMGGRLAAINIFKDLAPKAVKIAKIIGEGIEAIFPKKSNAQKGKIYAQMTKDLLAFIEGFRLLAKNTYRFKRVVAGVAAAADILFMAFSGIFRAVKAAMGPLNVFGNTFLDVMWVIAEFVIHLHDVIKSTDFFYKVVEGLIHIFKRVMKIAKLLGRNLKDAWTDIFPEAPKLTFDIEELITKILEMVDSAVEFVDNFKIAVATTAKLKQAVRNFAKALKYLHDKLIEGIAWMKAYNEENKVFERAMAWIRTTVDKVKLSISDFIDSLKELYDTFVNLEAVKEGVAWLQALTFDDVKASLDPLIEGFNKVRDALKEFGDEFKDTEFIQQMIGILHDIDDAIMESFIFGPKSGELGDNAAAALGPGVWTKITDWFSDKITRFGTWAKDVAQRMLDAVGKAFSEADMDATQGALSTLFLGIIAGSLLKMTNDNTPSTFFKTLFKDLFGFDDLADLIEALVEPLDGLISVLKAYQQNLKADALLKLAMAMAVLAGSLVVLSMIDPVALAAASAAMGTLMLELFGATSLLSKKGGSSVAKASGLLVALGVSIVAIAGAVRLLSTMDPEKVDDGLRTVTAAMASLVLATHTMGKKETSDLMRAAGAMVVIGIAVVILGQAVDKFGRMDANEITQGMVAMGIVLGGLTLVIDEIDSKETMVNASALLGLAIATGLLYLSVVKFGQMDYEELAKGLGAATVALTIMTVAINNLPKKSKLKGLAITGISAALLMLSDAFTVFALLSWDEILKGVLAMGISLAGIVLALTVLDGLDKDTDLMKMSASIIGVSAAMLILAVAMKMIAILDWDEIAKGLVVIGASMAILAIGLHFMSGTIAGSAAMLVASLAILTMAFALRVVGGLSIKAIITGFLAIGLAFVALGIASAVLAPAVPVIIGLGLGLFLLGAAFGIIGIGMGAAAAGLSMLMLAFIAFVEAFKHEGDTIVEMIPAMGTAMGIALANLFGELLLGLWAYIPRLIDLGKEILLKLIEGLHEVLPALMGAASDIFESFMGLFNSKYPSLIEAGWQLLLGFMDGMNEHMEEFIVLGGEIIQNYLKGATKELPGLIDAAGEFIVAFLEAIEDAIDKYMPDIIDRLNAIGLAILQGLIEGMIRQLGSIVEVVVDVFNLLVETFKDVFGIQSPSTEMMALAVEIVMGIVQGILDTMGELITTITQMVTDIIETFSERLYEFVTMGVEFVKHLVQGFKDEFDFRYDELKEKVGELITKLKTFFRKFIKYGKDLVTKIKEGFEEKFEEMIEAVTLKMEEILTTLRGYYETLILIGTEFVTNIITGLENATETLRLAIEALVTAITEKFDTYKTTFIGKGTELVEALAKGITDAIQKGIDAAEALADAVAGAVGAAWETHSPPKVFVRLGAAVPHALGIGMDSGRQHLMRTADAIAKEVQNGIGSFDMNFMEELDDVYRPVIRPVLEMDEVNEGLRRAFANDPKMSYGVNGLSTVRFAPEQNFGNSNQSETGVQFVQNNYSPKALDPAEVYRRTNSLVSRLRGTR